jgi:peptidyl-prolyl cis-trans isomerase D
MLNLFRKHATSWLIKVALILIAIVFIFWGGYSYRSREASRLAKVYDQFITYGEYQKAYDQLVETYRRQFGKMFSDDLLKQLNVKEQALEMLIERHLLLHAAEKLGLTASEEEVQYTILQYPVFLSDGKFEPERYRQVLRQARMTPEVFEGQMASELAAQKVEAFVKRQAMVTDEEVQATYLYDHTQIQLSYVTLDPKEFEAQVQPQADEIQTYYQEHQDKYRDPEKRQFALILFKTDQFLAPVSVTDGEIQYYYEDNYKKYHKESQVKARHILFKLSADASPEEDAKVRSQAVEVQTMARKPGADFAELAKKYSQDVGSAPKGGDLGLFSHSHMVQEFSDAAFKLKAGEISDPVRTPFGYHIIKVEEVRPEKTVPLAEARAEIEQTLKRDKARDLAFKAAQDFADLAYADKDIQKAAQNRKLAVLNSAWVSQKDTIAELGASPKATQPLFNLMKNEISTVLEVSDGFAVAQLMEIREPAVQAFDQVKEQARRDLVGERAGKLAEQRANEFLQMAKTQKNLEATAREQHLQAKKSGEFSRSKPDNTLNLPPEGLDKVFLLTEAQPFPASPIATGNTLLVCQLVSRKAPAAEAMAEESTTIRKRLLQQKQALIWQAWLEEQRKRAHVERLHEL